MPGLGHDRDVVLGRGGVKWTGPVGGVGQVKREKPHIKNLAVGGEAK